MNPPCFNLYLLSLTSYQQQSCSIATKFPACTAAGLQLHSKLPEMSFVLGDFPAVPIGPFLQPVLPSLNFCLASERADSSPQFGILYKFDERALHLLQVIYKDIKPL